MSDIFTHLLTFKRILTGLVVLFVVLFVYLLLSGKYSDVTGYFHHLIFKTKPPRNVETGTMDLVEWKEKGQTIHIREQTDLFDSPLSSQKSIKKLEEGMQAEIMDKRFHWYFIKLADGVEGWVKEDFLVKPD